MYQRFIWGWIAFVVLAVAFGVVLSLWSGVLHLPGGGTTTTYVCPNGVEQTTPCQEVLSYPALFQIGLYFSLILLFVGGIISGIREKVVQVKLGRSGIKVDRHITDHSTVSGYRGGKSYYLTYDYDYNGLPYSRKERSLLKNSLEELIC